MAVGFSDRVLDFGLDVFDQESTAIYIVSSAEEPTTYEIATGAGGLGFKSFGAGAVFNSPSAAGDGNGRRVTSNAITDGTIVTSGTAAWWAVVAAASSLHAHGSLTMDQSVTAGNSFVLAAFDITMRAR